MRNHNEYERCDGRVYTTQGTYKTFKAQKVISTAIMIIGFIMIMAEPTSTAAIALFLIGLVWYVVNRIRIWWNHS